MAFGVFFLKSPGGFFRKSRRGWGVVDWLDRVPTAEGTAWAASQLKTGDSVQTTQLHSEIWEHYEKERQIKNSRQYTCQRRKNEEKKGVGRVCFSGVNILGRGHGQTLPRFQIKKDRSLSHVDVALQICAGKHTMEMVAK